MKHYKTFAVAALAALSLAACGGDGDSTAVTETEKVERVKLGKVEDRTIDRIISLPTNLEGYETMQVSSTVSGIIERICVEVGDKVQKGQLLVRMDPTQYTNYKLQYANLGVEMARMDALKESGSISQQTYDQTKVQYDQLAETLKLYETNTFVRADYAGVISAKNFENGELCAGQPILTLTQIGTLKAYIAVPETYFPQIRKGMKLSLSSDIYPDREFPATVEIVYPTIDASTHTFTLKVRIPNASELLRPGMYVRTHLPVGKSSAMLVPYQSVLKLIGSNTRYIFLNNNGTAKRVEVTLGDRFDKDVEIISDEVKPGDEVVVAGQTRLVDGAKLEIVEASAE